MASTLQDVSTHASPLEDFVRDYTETAGGAWDEIEPQVYDVLLPGAAGAAWADDARGVLRLAFDPEAQPEHPGTQLASFGTPLIDRLLADAMERGRYACLYLVGLNLNPHDLALRVSRALTLGGGLQVRLTHVRPLHFVQAVYWFQATFVSDEKEQEIMPVALDLHYGRQVRHLEDLVNPARLSDQPAHALAEARRLSLAAGYPLARERVVRTLAPLANTRSREMSERLERQVARMPRYYADLRSELEQQEHRSRSRTKDPAKWAARREALDREEKLRVTELRQKSTLRVDLRLLNLLAIQQPKLLVQAQVASERMSTPVELVRDPLMETLEAVPCPNCERPTFALEMTRQGRLVCPACAAFSPAKAKPGQRAREGCRV
jgi:hypothetical protein